MEPSVIPMNIELTMKPLEVLGLAQTERRLRRIEVIKATEINEGK
jgi:hypothetical protein